jgi:hypothetical protein
MHPKKVAGRHWPGGPSGAMDPKTRAAAAAAASALFILLLSGHPDGKKWAVKLNRTPIRR